MKVLFLDIDGVLNSHEFLVNQGKAGKRFAGASAFDRDHNDFDPACVARLERIATTVTDLSIVISSTWRRLVPLYEIRKHLNDAGAPTAQLMVFDKTPTHADGFRGREIEEWIRTYNHSFEEQVANYVILDDDGDMLDHQKDGHFVQTSNLCGLTDSDVTRVISILDPILLQKKVVE